MRFIPAVLALALGCVGGRSADWLTDGNNPQRNNWQKDEKILTTANVKNMKLLWKLKLDNEPRQMHSLFPPLVAERVNTGSGVKQIALETGVSDNLYAIDVESGKVLWRKHFSTSYTPPANQRGAGILCPGGITATPVIAPAGAGK